MPSLLSAWASFRARRATSPHVERWIAPSTSARDDFDRAVKARRKLDLARDEQRLVHHLTEQHASLPT